MFFKWHFPADELHAWIMEKCFPNSENSDQ